MFVISRNTAFTYRDKPVSTTKIGEELKLIEAATDNHLSAERFERDINDLFALQDEITSSIAVALNLELVNAEAARPTDHLDMTKPTRG